jgi:hypothetical protein
MRDEKPKPSSVCCVTLEIHLCLLLYFTAESSAESKGGEVESDARRARLRLPVILGGLTDLSFFVLVLSDQFS